MRLMRTSTEKLEKIRQQVDSKAAEWAELQPLKAADAERLWKKLRLEWNYNSNHLEGNTLTYSETELLLLFDQTPGEPHTMRELEEMKAHDVAVALVRQWATEPDRELSEADIRSLNQTILVRPFWKEAMTPDGQPTRRLISVGEYKKHPNSVRLANGEMFHYTAPEAVAREMGELMKWYRTEGTSLQPAVAAALLHYRFVRIHPFDDGNGRISRLLLNYHLLRHHLPPVVIKTADKQNYLFALQRADVGDLDAFCAYVGEQLLWSLELGITAGKGESVEEVGDWEKELAVLGKKIIGDEEIHEVSNDLVYARIMDSALPLFNYLIENTKRFNFHFAKNENRINLRMPNQYDEYPSDSPEEITLWLYNRHDLAKLAVIDLSMYWSGYKGSPTDHNTIGVSIQFKPNRFQYVIQFLSSKENLLEKKYTSSINDLEQRAILEYVGKFLVEKIKSFK